MKKNTKIYLHILIGCFFVVPFYSYAEESIATVIQTKEIASITHSQESSSTTNSTSSKEKIEEVDVDGLITSCTQESIEKRDTDIATARNIYNNAMTNALSERKNREKAIVAINNQSEKKEAMKSSVENYKTSVKSAQNTLTQSRKTIWQTFESDIKKCHEIKKEEVSKNENDEEEGDNLKYKSFRKEDTFETKTIKETIKEQIEVIKSLFN